MRVQFLIESLLLAGLGGFAGTSLGVLAAMTALGTRGGAFPVGHLEQTLDATTGAAVSSHGAHTGDVSVRRHGVSRMSMLRRFPTRMRIPPWIADEAHDVINLARGSLSGDPYDATATQAYGQIIESIREPWGRGAPGDAEIKLGIGLGRHLAADTCLVYAAAQAIATARHMHMGEALQVLDAAVDNMAAGRPVTPRRPGPRHVPPGYRRRNDCDPQARDHGRQAQASLSSRHRHGSKRVRMH
jgi:hypothetical protein